MAKRAIFGFYISYIFVASYFSWTFSWAFYIVSEVASYLILIQLNKSIYLDSPPQSDT
jgi:hypothetical protein